MDRIKFVLKCRIDKSIEQSRLYLYGELFCKRIKENLNIINISEYEFNNIPANCKELILNVCAEQLYEIEGEN